MRTILLFLILVAPVAAQRAAAVLIDQFANVPCEDFRGRIDNYFAELSNSPDWTGVIIAFEGKHVDYRLRIPKLVLPVPGEVNTRINIIRSHIEFRKFDPTRITFTSGGFREEHQFEFYKVPPGGKFPIAKPTLDWMKYRQGKPIPLVDC